MTTTGTPTQRRSTVPTLNWTLSTNKKKPRLGSRGIREKLLTLYSLLPCNRVSMPYGASLHRSASVPDGPCCRRQTLCESGVLRRMAKVGYSDTLTLRRQPRSKREASQVCHETVGVVFGDGDCLGGLRSGSRKFNQHLGQSAIGNGP